MHATNIIVSDRPPYAQTMYNCVLQCPMEGRHHVAIHIQEESQIQLDEGTHEWINKATNVSEYCDTYTNISYDVVEHDVDEVIILWTWLRDLIWGRPDIQTVFLSFTVVVPSSSSSVHTGSVGSRETPDVDALAEKTGSTGVVEDRRPLGEDVLGTDVDAPKGCRACEDVNVHE